MDTKELIAKLKAAEGPSRELDIVIFLTWPPAEGAYRRDAEGDVRDELNDWVNVPRYTCSIDAALRLVPEGWSWLVSVNENHRYPHAQMGRSYPTNASVTLMAATPALAICIAALKAREVANG